MFNVIQGIVIRMFKNLCACFNPKPMILESYRKYMKPKPKYQNTSLFISSFIFGFAYKAIYGKDSVSFKRFNF